jgi:uncharacterized membrane protein HdeD (DUF308 family)
VTSGRERRLAGVLRVWSGFRLRPGTGWGWLLASGTITILAGVVVVISWPANILWLLGLVLALDLTFQGVTAIRVRSGGEGPPQKRG